MKITNIIEETKPISSNIKNAYIDFSKMTLSLVAVCSDVIKNGKPVIGYGFNSNGRYGQGHLIRERFRPRILEAETNKFLNEEGNNFDPIKMWDVMMANEKPGGHGERSVAVGTIDMAIWDLVSKIEEKPLYQMLSEKYGNGNANRNVFVYAAGGYYWPDQGITGLTDEIKKYLDLGYSVVKKKIGGASLSDDCKRIEAVLKILGPNDKLAVDANGRFDLETAIKYAKALSKYNLFWYEEPGDPLDFEHLLIIIKALWLLARICFQFKTPEILFAMQE
jgi:L-alanine-DL-glutamate epimerase-like enolase superfamily enzyme